MINGYMIADDYFMTGCGLWDAMKPQKIADKTIEQFIILHS